jgi:tRNA(Arg) A34 adenosine deaminase TadA
MLGAVAEASSVITEAASAPLDAERMRSLIAFTMKTMDAPNPVPYGAEIFDSKTGESLMRALNRVGEDHDPSGHGEIVTIRQACAKLQARSLKGYTLYTTCEPCPMCMSCCLWAELDRVVYGATIEDAARFGHQIMIPSAEVARRTDLHTAVTGPVERERALELFTNAKMQAVMKAWK